MSNPATVGPDLVPVGKLPELGVVPQKMKGFVIREERFGEPQESFVEETVPVPELGAGEVLIQVMAAGVNYGGVRAGQGKPVNVIKVHGGAHHIAGSDAAGVVWRVGPGVNNCKVGDQIVVHCNQACGNCHHCESSEPMACRSQQIWGYETSDGSFAQYCKVQAQQILKKPEHLSWEEAASPDVVFEHVGGSTFPTSVLLANRFGCIAIGGATTGYDLTFDVHHLWMHQKRIADSHFASAGGAYDANERLLEGTIRPAMTRLFQCDEIPEAHQRMFNDALCGTVPALPGAPRAGLKNLEETHEAMG